MAMLGRRFVNIVAAGKYKTGMLSVHHLDVTKHLFYPSASEARLAGGDGDEAPRQRPRPPTTEELQKLPAPCAIFSDATTAAERSRSTAFFSLVSQDSRILFINEAGDSKMYYADEGCPTGHIHAMPRLEEFAGPVAASVSDAGGAAKEESLYLMHGVRDGRAPRFHVLSRVGEGWSWQSLPSPPLVSDLDDEPDAVISSYTVVDGGRTICVSSIRHTRPSNGTWCFDTVRGEWWHAGDWEMPFHGRAEYLTDLDLWLGFSSTAVGLWITGTSITYVYGELCTTSGLSLSSMAMKKPPTLLQRLYKPPEDWMKAPKAKQVELINLGSGRFAIAKVFHLKEGLTSDWDYGLDEDIGNQILVVTGVEIRPRQPPESCHIWSSRDGLELIPHKSLTYMCDRHWIHQVL